MDAPLRDYVQLAEYREDMEQRHCERERDRNLSKDGILPLLQLLRGGQITVQRIDVDFFCRF